MVLEISPYGQTLDTEIVGYDSPNYGGFTSFPTRIQVLRYYFFNYIHLYCVLETLKNAINLTCF
jgi:hypothetical protein